jgi:hypothetical protein
MGQAKEAFMEMRENEETDYTPARKSIFNIEIDYLRLMDEIESNEGELTPELESRLTINKAELETKSVSYGYVIRQFDNEVDNIQKEIDRLTARKKRKEKNAEDLKERIKNAMIMYGVTKIELNNLTLSFRKSESLVVEKTENIPAKYKSFKSVEVIDNATLKADVKAGAIYDGIKIQENKNLQIK